MNELKEWLKNKIIKFELSKSKFRIRKKSTLFKIADISLVCYKVILEKLEELEKKKCVWIKYKSSVSPNLFIPNCFQKNPEEKEKDWVFCPFCGLQIECEEITK